MHQEVFSFKLHRRKTIHWSVQYCSGKPWIPVKHNSTLMAVVPQQDNAPCQPTKTGRGTAWAVIKSSKGWSGLQIPQIPIWSEMLEQVQLHHKTPPSGHVPIALSPASRSKEAWPGAHQSPVWRFNTWESTFLTMTISVMWRMVPPSAQSVALSSQIVRIFSSSSTFFAASYC